MRRCADSPVSPTGCFCTIATLCDASTIPSHLLARFARQRVKVVLSGEGADELFAGYPTYFGHRVAAGYQRLPAGLARELVKAFTSSPIWQHPG